LKLRDLMAGLPLEGGRLDPELEINSISAAAEDELYGSAFVELPGSGLTGVQARNLGAAAIVPGGEDPWKTLGVMAGNWFCHPARNMTLICVAGDGEGDLVVHLMRAMLERMPHTRVGTVAPNGIRFRGVELPRGRWMDSCVQLQAVLRRMADARCTHVIIQLDQTGMERRLYSGLRMSVTALTGPVSGREELSGLLCASDTVVLNLDEKDWEDYADIIPEHTFTYSENKTCADLTAKNLRLYPGHMEFEAVAVGHVQRIHLPVPGGFSLYHGLCALSCGLCLGLKWERMARVMRCVQGPQGRMEVLSVPAAYTVVLDRADCPQSLEKLLTSAREFTAGQLVCVLGCNEQGASAVRVGMGSVAEQLSDRVVLTGSNLTRRGRTDIINDVREGMGAWQRPCVVEADRSKAVRYALEQAGPGDVIVFAGPPDEQAEKSAQPDEREFIRSCICAHHRILKEKRIPTGR